MGDLHTIFGIESTCDETACAVVRCGTEVLSSIVASQARLHEAYRGVVPEIASRAHVEWMQPTIRRALDSARCGWDEIDAIAVAHRPGLIGSLLVGLSAAKTLAWTLGKPLIGVDHVQAHLYSIRLNPTGGTVKTSDSRSDVGFDASIHFPAIGMVCSGGHTALYRLASWRDIELIGKTLDDAVGEAYDKVAAILGLGYPGGPIIDRLAASGDGRAVDFPRSMLSPESLDFSFSGLKTAVLYHVKGHAGRERDAGALSAQQLADVAASFQSACVETLIRKLKRAIDRFGARSVVVGGGVSANTGLRAALPSLALPTFVPPPEFCTDNAAMIAGLACEHSEAGRAGRRGAGVDDPSESGLNLDAATSSELTRVEASGSKLGVK